MYKIEICDKCKGTNSKSLLSKIKKLYPNVSIKLGCIQFCGVGRDNIVILVNHIPIIGKTEDEVLEKLKEMLSIETL